MNTIGIVSLKTGEVLFWFDWVTHQVIDRGMSFDVVGALAARTILKSHADWCIYKYQPISRQYDEDGNELPLYLSDLDLSPMTAADLPRSMHIAALTAVDTVNRKGTVVRKWMGQNYTYDRCYCSAQALAEYQAGRLKLYNNSYGVSAPENADSFVLVYFVSENPYDQSLEIPVIVDKLVK